MSSRLAKDSDDPFRVFNLKGSATVVDGVTADGQEAREEQNDGGRLCSLESVYRLIWH